MHLSWRHYDGAKIRPVDGMGGGGDYYAMEDDIDMVGAQWCTLDPSLKAPPVSNFDG